MKNETGLKDYSIPAPAPPSTITETETETASAVRLSSFTIPWETCVILYSVFGIGLCSIISILGLVTNTLVMTVFCRQGVMAESSTVSLFALALADFVIQVSHIFLSAANAAEFVENSEMVRIGALRIDPAMVEMLSFRAKIIFGHINCWLTAYLSFERCFSVMFPFHVKRTFSPKNSLISVICIYTGSIFTFLPLMLRFGVKEMTANNRTIITFYRASYLGELLANLSILVNPIILRPVGIILVVVCNAIILIKVKSSKEWRKSVTAGTTTTSNTSSAAKDSDTTKEQQHTTGNSSRNRSHQHKEDKLIKMIFWISGIFLVCTTPDIVMVALSQMEVALVDLSVKKTGYGFVFFAESVSSSINIFVYYFMSTNFKKEFQQFFQRNKQL